MPIALKCFIRDTDLPLLTKQVCTKHSEAKVTSLAAHSKLMRARADIFSLILR